VVVDWIGCGLVCVGVCLDVQYFCCVCVHVSRCVCVSDHVYMHVLINTCIGSYTHVLLICVSKYVHLNLS